MSDRPDTDGAELSPAERELSAALAAMRPVAHRGSRHDALLAGALRRARRRMRWWQGASAVLALGLAFAVFRPFAALRPGPAPDGSRTLLTEQSPGSDVEREWPRDEPDHEAERPRAHRRATLAGAAAPPAAASYASLRREVLARGMSWLIIQPAGERAAR